VTSSGSFHCFLPTPGALRSADGDVLSTRKASVEPLHEFSSKIGALLSMTGQWKNDFVVGELMFGRGSNGGFWSRNVENALSFNRD
jgi:hypothetical protein